MTPEALSSLLRDVLAEAVEDGVVTLADGLPAAVTVERPRQREHGDYATNVALQLAKRAGMPPRQLADDLADRLAAREGIARVDVAGPGFVNITLDTAAQGEVVRTVVEAGSGYGGNASLGGQRFNLEFVSANPTGPLHLGHVRWAAVGDALARVLLVCGAEVTREYYFNDAGAQVDRFADSLLAAAKGEPTPPDGYGGAYVADIAHAVLARRPGLLEHGDADALAAFHADGLHLMFEEIKRSLSDFGVRFDVYFNEKDLHDKGELDSALERLSESGNVYLADGATWLRTTTFGDDKDRVLVKADGSWTYFAADAAYYLDKRERGFDRVLIMLGADHHGYVARYRALAAAYGDDPSATLEILIGQLVNLFQDGKPLRMSKRAGTTVTLEELVEAIGADAGRYALARYSTDSPIDLDLDLWARRTSDNPVFYVQYAHARTAGVLRNARELGLDLGEVAGLQPQLLEHEREGDLLGALGEFPRVVATAAELREPHRIARYLEELAGTYHRFYDACRVLPRGDEATTPLHTARLWLVEATRTVLANGLGLLGVSAPERM